MSEKNVQNDVNNMGNGGEQKQDGFLKRAWKGIRKGYDRFRYSKAGRVIVPTVKGLTVVGAVYEAYKAGQKSVKPTTVYIEPVQDEAPAGETPAEEEKAEKTE